MKHGVGILHVRDRQLFTPTKKGTRRLRITSLTNQKTFLANCHKQFDQYVLNIYVTFTYDELHPEEAHITKYGGMQDSLSETLIAYEKQLQFDLPLPSQPPPTLSYHLTNKLLAVDEIGLFYKDPIKTHSFDPPGTRLIDDCLTIDPITLAPTQIHITLLAWWVEGLDLTWPPSQLQNIPQRHYLPTELLELASLNTNQLRPVLTLDLTTLEFSTNWVINQTHHYESEEQQQQVARLNNLVNCEIAKKLSTPINYHARTYSSSSPTPSPTLCHASSPLRRYIDLFHQSQLTKLKLPIPDLEKLNEQTNTLRLFKKNIEIQNLAYRLPQEGQIFETIQVAPTLVKLKTLPNLTLKLKCDPAPPQLKLFPFLQAIKPQEKLLISYIEDASDESPIEEIMLEEDE